MAFVSEIFDQIRDQLDDTADSQVAFATKKLYANMGIRRMFSGGSGIWRLVTDSTVALVDDTFEYAIPSTVSASGGRIVSVEVETELSSAQYTRLTHYDVIPGDEDLAGRLIFTGPYLPSEEGALVRIRAAVPCSQISAATYVAAQSETWAGPDAAIHLPALYALGMIAARRLDNRQDHTRYSTTQASNSVQDQDIMQSSQLWLAQFELELDAMSRPLPIAKD